MPLSLTGTHTHPLCLIDCISVSFTGYHSEREQWINFICRLIFHNLHSTIFKFIIIICPLLSVPAHWTHSLIKLIDSYYVARTHRLLLIMIRNWQSLSYSQRRRCHFGLWLTEDNIRNCQSSVVRAPPLVLAGHHFRNHLHFHLNSPFSHWTLLICTRIIRHRTGSMNSNRFS